MLTAYGQMTMAPPVAHVVRGIVLKGVGLDYLWPNLLPVASFGAALFTLAVLRFRKQLD